MKRPKKLSEAEYDRILMDALEAGVSPMQVTDERLIAYGRRCLAAAQPSGRPALSIVAKKSARSDGNMLT